MASWRTSTGGLWLGGQDVMAELGREYRKAAEEALRRGDFRRAASIYGKLLRDFRAAANALMRGGLHHDAAIVLLAKLDDRRGAARAFEAAGEVDRAVQLYRQGHEHEEAGDLLRRVGEEDAAQAEYLAAADRLAGTFDGHLAAGDLLLAKAGRPDLALAHFAAGWSRRPLGNAIPCALRIARIHAERGDAIGPAGADRRGRRHLRDVVPQPSMRASSTTRWPGSPIAPGWRRCGRSCATGRCWGSPPSSADAPARGRRRRRSPRSSWDRKAAGPPRSSATRASPSRPRRERPSRTCRGRPPTPRSVGSASVPGPSPRWPRPRDRARSSSASRGARSSASGPIDPMIFHVTSHDLPVLALATDPDGERLVILREGPSRRGVISSYARQPDGSYRLLVGTTFPMEGLTDPWLTPVLTDGSRVSSASRTADPFRILSVGSLIAWDTSADGGPRGEPPGRPAPRLGSQRRRGELSAPRARRPAVVPDRHRQPGEEPPPRDRPELVADPRRRQSLAVRPP